MPHSFQARLDFASDLLGDRPLHFEPTAGLVVAHLPGEVPEALERLARAQRDGLWAVGYIAYEAAPAADAALPTWHPDPRLPLLCFLLCDGPRPLADDRPLPDEPGLTFDGWCPAWHHTSYRERFRQVQRHIREGNTYQVNLSFPLASAWHGDPATYYRQLTRALGRGYGAHLTGPGWQLLSASPELFFERRGEYLLTRPMKGTRPRGLTLAQDRAHAEDLRHHPKDRAENVMIVDLLRNDLGRVAEIGTVHPEALFTVEKYPTVWQMTSRVVADLQPGVDFPRLFRALFPCGSVTGAPKVKTMEIIRDLEQGPRGVYCGAIGCLLPNGDAVFNVAIRTLLLFSGGRAEYHVGSGLVADSEADEEYQECCAKARVLDRATVPDFRLYETLNWQPGHGYDLEELHLARLQASAEYFDFPWDRPGLLAALHQAARHWRRRTRVRLVLARDGSATVSGTEFAPRPPALVAVARTRVDSADLFLHHKTTHRRAQDDAKASRPEADEVILVNEREELTECTIANLAVWHHDHWLTPPLHCGLLPGTMRQALLAAGKINEGIVTIDDLRASRRLLVFNSVRGICEFAVDDDLLGRPLTPWLTADDFTPTTD